MYSLCKNLDIFTILEQDITNKNFSNFNFSALRYADVLLLFAQVNSAINNSPTTNTISYLDEIRPHPA